MQSNTEKKIVNKILAAHPNTQAIYLYGSWGTEYQGRGSDIDIGVLLPPEVKGKIDRVAWFRLSCDIAEMVGTEHADLIDLRTAPTDLQSEVINANRQIYCKDEIAALDFESMTLVLWQELNYHRKEIDEAAMKSGGYYGVG